MVSLGLAGSGVAGSGAVLVGLGSGQARLAGDWYAVAWQGMEIKEESYGRGMYLY